MNHWSNCFIEMDHIYIMTHTQQSNADCQSACPAYVTLTKCKVTWVEGDPSSHCCQTGRSVGRRRRQFSKSFQIILIEGCLCKSLHCMASPTDPLHLHVSMMRSRRFFKIWDTMQRADVHIKWDKILINFFSSPPSILVTYFCKQHLLLLPNLIFSHLVCFWRSLISSHASTSFLQNASNPLLGVGMTTTRVAHTYTG